MTAVCIVSYRGQFSSLPSCMSGMGCHHRCSGGPSSTVWGSLLRNWLTLWRNTTLIKDGRYGCCCCCCIFHSKSFDTKCRYLVCINVLPTCTLLVVVFLVVYALVYRRDGCPGHGVGDGTVCWLCVCMFHPSLHSPSSSQISIMPLPSAKGYLSQVGCQFSLFPFNPPLPFPLSHITSSQVHKSVHFYSVHT